MAVLMEYFSSLNSAGNGLPKKELKALKSADAFSVVGGRCTGRARRCKARQGRRGKTALTCEYLVPQ